MLFSFGFFWACQDQVKDIDTAQEVSVDADGDGYFATDDCDDLNAAVNAGATEICDGLDNNCDGVVDEEVTTTFYADRDNDGYGDGANTLEACTVPQGYSTNGSDCDDQEADVFPGNPEVCDGLDNDCNEAMDDEDSNLDLESAMTMYLDADGDGFGDATQTFYRCTEADGYVDNNEDCDDTRSSIHPEAVEICDGVDNDCDGLLDLEDDSIDSTTGLVYYLDFDEDGFGDAQSFIVSCEAVAGYVENDDDCDDAATNVHPQAPEICDGIDNNCDFLADDLDTNLDLSTATIFYVDGDYDGFGDAGNTQSFCVYPGYGYSENAQDCNDAESFTYPGAAQLEGSACLSDLDNDGYAPLGQGGQDCDDADAAISPTSTDIVGDGVDQNCDGLDGTDVDGDGFASLASGGDDCDDGDTSVYTGALDDSIDGVDQNCDGIDGTDADGDGYASLGSGGDDCDDASSGVNVGVSDIVGDGVDQNCDGIDGTDADGDGYASLGSGGDDCDDASSGVNVDATDEVGDGVDQNCDDLDGIDVDGDGFASLSSGGDDCDDYNMAVLPSATDIVGDGVDQNCDGIDGTDTDEDGYASRASGGDDCDDSNADRYGDMGDEECPGASCAEILEEGYSVGDGVYWLDPTGTSPLEIYCDMTNDGGGWTLIGKTSAGDYTAISDQEFVNLIANPTENVNVSLLLEPDVPQTGEIAFLDRATTNALFHSSSEYVVRVTMTGNLMVVENNQTFFQQKISPSGSWDFWNAIRNTELWGTYTQGPYLDDFGTSVTLGRTYSAITGMVTHEGDGTFGAWDFATLTAANGEDIEVSRHMGLVCDGWGSYGHQWLLTSNPSDYRWKSDLTDAKSVIYFK